MTTNDDATTRMLAEYLDMCEANVRAGMRPDFIAGDEFTAPARMVLAQARNARMIRLHSQILAAGVSHDALNTLVGQRWQAITAEYQRPSPSIAE